MRIKVVKSDDGPPRNRELGPSGGFSHARRRLERDLRPVGPKLAVSKVRGDLRLMMEATRLSTKCPDRSRSDVLGSRRICG